MLRPYQVSDPRHRPSHILAEITQSCIMTHRAALTARVVGGVAGDAYGQADSGAETPHTRKSHHPRSNVHSSVAALPSAQSQGRRTEPHAGVGLRGAGQPLQHPQQSQYQQQPPQQSQQPPQRPNQHAQHRGGSSVHHAQGQPHPAVDEQQPYAQYTTNLAHVPSPRVRTQTPTQQPKQSHRQQFPQDPAPSSREGPQGHRDAPPAQTFRHSQQDAPLAQSFRQPAPPSHRQQQPYQPHQLQQLAPQESWPVRGEGDYQIERRQSFALDYRPIVPSDFVHLQQLFARSLEGWALDRDEDSLKVYSKLSDGFQMIQTRANLEGVRNRRRRRTATLRYARFRIRVARPIGGGDITR